MKKSIFVERVKELIKINNLTQRDLANDVGVTESTMSKYLSGDRIPGGETLSNLATALKTTTDYLLGLNNENKTMINNSELRLLLARSTKELTPEEKNELISIILDNK
ncbi:MAG: helix-turn-helix transcriptional regulator [Bacilli bacterium]|nr:helix-turn-helix transcriptional regulator [Bacilli bacterium]